MPVEQAFVMPSPGGPEIVGVIERRRSGRVDQQILLATDSRTSGQNSFLVHVAAHATSEIVAPAAIIADMRAALPGIGMKRSPYFVQNRYGPFGYAIGHSGASDLCFYGWQRIRAKATLLSNQGLIDVRLRLCQTGATEQKLLSVMYNYTIDAFFEGAQWNPYGDPAAPPADLGARGPDIYPLGETRFETVVSPLPRSAPRKRQTAGTVTAPVVDTAVVEPTGPLVPPPPASSAAAVSPPTGAATVAAPPTVASPETPLVPPPPAEAASP